jgi:uncharacterized protein with FMN-binding domain
MKKFILSGFLILIFALYALYQRGGEYVYVAPPASVVENKQTEPAQNPYPATPVINIPSPAPVPKIAAPNPSRTFNDGAYVGNVADAYYGNIQVKAIIRGDKIIDVQFLDYPHDRRTSISINTRAMPDLKSEAIQAQSSNVDIVSGATDTSNAFRESLASALAKAKT